MLPILIDGVLSIILVALVAAGAWQIFSLTGAGVRLQQTLNRRKIERGSGYVCSLHGPCADRDLVRLRSGDTICPQCYLETYHADLH